MRPSSFSLHKDTLLDFIDQDIYGRSHKCNDLLLISTNMELGARKQSLFNACPREVNPKVCEKSWPMSSQAWSCQMRQPKGLIGSLDTDPVHQNLTPVLLATSAPTKATARNPFHSPVRVASPALAVHSPVPGELK